MVASVPPLRSLSHPSSRITELPFRSVENIHRVLGNLRSLNFRGNRITRTCGLERMFSLEKIDLSHNAIRRLEDAARLSSLPLLRSVFLEGNPLEAE